MVNGRAGGSTWSGSETDDFDHKPHHSHILHLRKDCRPPAWPVQIASVWEPFLARRDLKPIHHGPHGTCNHEQNSWSAEEFSIDCYPLS